MDPEANTPDQQAPAPGQQAPSPQEDWKPRYDGAIRKIQELTESKKAVEGQLAKKSSTIEQLQQQLSARDAEFDAIKGQQQSAFDGLKADFDKAQANLAELQAFQTKVEVARELGHPELIQILDTIPGSDKDAIKKVMETVIGFAQGQVKVREAELRAGVTPPAGPPSVSMPQTAEEWEARIQSLPENSKERAEAWDAYHDFLFKT